MFLIVDTETSGMPRFDCAADDPRQPHIIQLGALLCEGPDLRIVAQLDHLIAPKGFTEIEEGAYAVHGITFDKLVDEGVDMTLALASLDAMWEQATTYIGYSARFDLTLLRGARRRCGQPDRFDSLPVFEVMAAARPHAKAVDKNGKSKAPKLTEAVKALCGREHTAAHGALDDCLATRDVVLALMQLGVQPVGVAGVEASKKGPATKPAPAMVPMTASDEEGVF